MRLRLQRYLPYLVGAGLILLCLAYWGELRSPYIEHDDWDFLLPPGWGHGYATPWQKTLSEGRWINYLWYLGVGMHWSAQAAARAYLGLLIFFACLFGFAIEQPWKKLLVILVVFFSPAFAQLSTWPAVLTASALVLALATSCFLSERALARNIALAVFTFLAIMSYSGAAPLILLAHIYLGKVERPRQLGASLAIYLASYALAILAIASLNYFYHDHFGLVIENWRRPHAPQNLHDLWSNLLLQLAVFGASMRFLWGLVLIWLVAIAVLLRSPWRWRLICVVAASVLAFSMDTGISVLDGLGTPFRAMGWVWITLMLPMLFLTDSNQKVIANLGYLGLVWMLAVGVISWNGVYRTRKPAGDYIYALGKDLSQIRGDRSVVLVGDVRSVPPLHPLWNSPKRQIQMALLKIYGIPSRACEPGLCNHVKAYVQTHRIDDLMFDYQGQMVVYFRPGASSP